MDDNPFRRTWCAGFESLATVLSVFVWLSTAGTSAIVAQDRAGNWPSIEQSTFECPTKVFADDSTLSKSWPQQLVGLPRHAGFVTSSLMPQSTRRGTTLLDVQKMGSMGIQPSVRPDVLSSTEFIALPPCHSACDLPYARCGPGCKNVSCFSDPSRGGPFTFRDDRASFLPMLRDDSRAILNWHNGLILAVAAGGAIALHQDVDGAVRSHSLRHPNRWGGASKTIGKFGDITVQLPLLFALYGYTLRQQDDELHDFTRTLFSAYTLTGLTTVTLKAAVNSDRPSDRWNGGQFGFPSFHAASSFAIASVIDEYYGPKAGFSAYAFASIIGWTRIDERDHDLSDILFGAALGYVIGKSVAGYHLHNNSSARLWPSIDPVNGTGRIVYERRF